MTPHDSRLTIIALARNEARHLGPCFRSLQLLVELSGAETLVVLDDRADDATARIARSLAHRVATSHFVNFSSQRNRALELATTEWVFFIDADERCTAPLGREIASVLGRAGCDAFRVPRRNIFFGREVRHTGWWPDYQTRLLRRANAHYDESRQVHEYPILPGETCTLLNPLVHFNYDNWRHFIRKQRAYAPMEARALFKEGQRARLRSVIGQPLRELKRRYIDYEGYRDGFTGLALSVAMALYRGETYRQLRRIQREAQGESAE
jgi:glycosyltransferase involved in cell wall biosynthesis